MNDHAQPTPIALPLGLRRRKASAIASPTPIALHGLDAARKQIELMTGSPDTIIRVRTVNSALPKGALGASYEFEGGLAALYERICKLNLGGHNIYVVAQPTRPCPGFASNADVVGVRGFYADGDGAAFPEAWHVAPTYVLRHPQTGRWWAQWTVTAAELARLPEWIKRIAAHYGSDATICNPARVIRLAGFGRWKDGKSYDPYDLEVMSGIATEEWMHCALPELPARAKVDASRLNEEDVIAAERLRNALAFVHPANRKDWLRVIFAVRDAKVLLPNLERMEPDEVIALLDDWASGELWKAHPGRKLTACDVGKYQGYEDIETVFNGKRGSAEVSVTLGSVVHMAKEHAQKQGLQVPPETCRRGAAELGMRPVASPNGATPANDDDTPLVLHPLAPRDSAAELLRRKFTKGGHATLVRDRGKFHRWGGRRWAPVEPERFDAEIWEFLGNALRKKDADVVPFSPQSKHVAEVRQALMALAHTPDGAEAPCWLDGRAGPDPKQLLVVSNGLLNLTTRELIPHTPAFFSPNALDFAYDPAATTPEWDKFLGQIWGDDQEQHDTLQEMFGLLLTDETSHQKAFMLAGPRRSGKGTLGRILQAVIGSANATGTTLPQLSSRFGKASLIGKRLAVAGDVQLGPKTDLDELAQSILSLTGEDTINVERKNTSDWVGRLKVRLVLLANELPKITNASGTLASRFIMFRLTQSFFDREDHELEGRLLQELPGILNWALDGLVRLRQRGRFVQPKSCADALIEMEHLGSPVRAYLAERCVVAPEHTVDCGEMYADFRAWCEGGGIKNTPTAATFGQKLNAALPGLKTSKVGSRGQQARRYQGVGLKKDEAAPAPAQDNVTTMRRKRAG